MSVVYVELLFEWKIIIGRWKLDINSNRNIVRLQTGSNWLNSTIIERKVYFYICEILILWRICSGHQDKDKVVQKYTSRLVFQVISNLIFHCEAPVYKVTWDSELG